ncbi:MAG: class I adenylate-forming enzyme family protein, partial [Promethearchaeota archaeon]
VGEILIKGDHVIKGYFKNPEANSVTKLENGFLKTGDLGYFDEENFLFLGGRSKDMIIRGGENIYPIEVEEILFQFPGVLEAAVIGRPDEVYGQVPKAFVVMKGGYESDEKQIIDFCKKHMADFKVPVGVEFWESLPKSKVGKLDKKSLFTYEKTKLGK